MDEQRLRQIEERVNAATPGPWFARLEPRQCEIGAPTANIAILLDGGTQGDEFWRNRDFIATSRTDIPDLLRALRAARAEIQRLREPIARLVSGCINCRATGWVMEFGIGELRKVDCPSCAPWRSLLRLGPGPKSYAEAMVEAGEEFEEVAPPPETVVATPPLAL